MKLRKRQTTITEEYSPTFRRRLPTNYLNMSLPDFEVFEIGEDSEIDISVTPTEL